MGWADDHLHEYLDAKGDLRPPWAEFPTYTRYSLGWRMGGGETWLTLYWAFRDRLTSPEARLAYLRRHPAAPYTWANRVCDLLDIDYDEYDDDTIPIDALASRGLIESDISYRIWLKAQGGQLYPIWEKTDDPVVAARHWSRELWFTGRQIEALHDRGELELPQVEGPWAPLLQEVARDTLEAIDPAQGLLSLSRMLLCGKLQGPWALGMALEDFEDSFEDDMGFADAFRLLLINIFDDRPHLDRVMARLGLEAESPWASWVAGETGWLLPGQSS